MSTNNGQSRRGSGGKRLAASVGTGALAALLALAGCQTPPERSGASASNSPAASDPGVGSFSFELTLGGGFRISQASYDVSGNGFHKAATLDVASSTALSTVIGGIPFGVGYVATLTVQDAAHKLAPCTGSATFDISGAATVQVPIHLDCRELKATAPQSVPLPPIARYALAALLLVFGALGIRRSRRRPA
jgi:hypothetical protein